MVRPRKAGTRFSSVLVNIGEGDFGLRATRDTQNGDWHVEQLIPHVRQAPRWWATPAQFVWGGDGHEHWHVKRVAINRLHRLDESGNVMSGRLG